MSRSFHHVLLGARHGMETWAEAQVHLSPAEISATPVLETELSISDIYTGFLCQMFKRF